jgi:hypothetical protein
MKAGTKPGVEIGQILMYTMLEERLAFFEPLVPYMGMSFAAKPED